MLKLILTGLIVAALIFVIGYYSYKSLLGDEKKSKKGDKNDADCVGSWQKDGACEGECGKDKAKQKMKFEVQKEATAGGSCPDKGKTKTVPCTKSSCPDNGGDEPKNVDCQGSWGECSNPCGKGTMTYTVTREASGNGTACPTPLTKDCEGTKCPEKSKIGKWLDSDFKPPNEILSTIVGLLPSVGNFACGVIKSDDYGDFFNSVDDNLDTGFADWAIKAVFRITEIIPETVLNNIDILKNMFSGKFDFKELAKYIVKPEIWGAMTKLACNVNRMLLRLHKIINRKGASIRQIIGGEKFISEVMTGFQSGNFGDFVKQVIKLVRDSIKVTDKNKEVIETIFGVLDKVVGLLFPSDDNLKSTMLKKSRPQEVDYVNLFETFEFDMYNY